MKKWRHSGPAGHCQGCHSGILANTRSSLDGIRLTRCHRIPSLRYKLSPSTHEHISYHAFPQSKCRVAFHSCLAESLQHNQAGAIMIPISQVIKLRLRGIKPFIPHYPAHRQWNWDPHPSWADSKAHALDYKGLWVSKRASSPWNQHLQGLPDQRVAGQEAEGLGSTLGPAPSCPQELGRVS